MADKLHSFGFRGRYVILGASLILGIALLYLGSYAGKNNAQKTEETPSDIYSEAEKWCAYLEDEARRLCENTAGVGDVTVVITLSGGVEQIYAEDTETRGTDRSYSHVSVGSGSSAHLCPVKTMMPEIAGIGVCCRGGGDAGTRAELISLLAAAFGVGANKIYITAAG